MELSGDEGSDPNAKRSGILELLKPVDWYAASFAGNDRVGNAWGWLEIEEWGVRGTAKLLAIKPCPKVKPGLGRLIMMRSVTSYSGPMASVQFKDAAGQTDTITGTDGHPVYSIDRCGYVDLGSLGPGERVRTADGWATAESMARWWGREVVHNLEVDGVHRYAVGSSRVTVHNSSAAGSAACRPKLRSQLPKRVTDALPPADVRNSSETRQARNFFKRHREAAMKWWSERNGGQAWPTNATHAEHPRPLADGDDPLYIEPGFGAPAAVHMQKGSDGLSDFERWGRRGGRPRR